MKTKSLSILLAILSILPVYANEEKDSTEVENPAKTVEVETEFSMVISDNTMNVKVNGIFDQFSSVSITTTRGTDIEFRFISNGNNELKFDLSELMEGTYYLVLNTDSEIRIKRFVKN